MLRRPSKRKPGDLSAPFRPYFTFLYLQGAPAPLSEKAEISLVTGLFRVILSRQWFTFDLGRETSPCQKKVSVVTTVLSLHAILQREDPEDFRRQYWWSPRINADIQSISASGRTVRSVGAHQTLTQPQACPTGVCLQHDWRLPRCPL
jgi:hypothetical protein